MWRSHICSTQVFLSILKRSSSIGSAQETAPSTGATWTGLSWRYWKVWKANSPRRLHWPSWVRQKCIPADFPPPLNKDENVLPLPVCRRQAVVGGPRDRPDRKMWQERRRKLEGHEEQHVTYDAHEDLRRGRAERYRILEINMFCRKDLKKNVFYIWILTENQWHISYFYKKKN